MTRRVAIVPHTHWDREWYLPFQSFRLRLVSLLDDLLPRLDADPGYRHFLLDGQMAVVDDHLAVRPQAEGALRRLATSGRLAMGPWYVLPDEFLVSGETHVRNLQLGLERAAAFGGAMEVGYLPDMFGHIAQMPQLLRQFGFEDAVVWRGVPLAVNRTAFWWQSPDGSTVRAEYLPSGYGNGAAMSADPKELLDRLRGWQRDNAALLGDAPILWMNGSDHQVPQAHLSHLVDEANALAPDEFDLRVTSLAEYLADAPCDDLPRWQGELRSGARANLLMGVASNRTDVRQAAARAERALERLAEPLQSLFALPENWPQSFLDEAWRDVIRNAAHDSVCACSVDEVCDAVLHRYAEARQIAEGLADQALRVAGALTSASGPVAVNPSHRRRSGLVEIRVNAEGELDGAQVVGRRASRRLVAELSAASAPAVIGEIVGWSADLSGMTYDVGDGTLDVTILADGTTGEVAERSAVIARITALTHGDANIVVRGWRQDAPSRTALVRAVDVPGFGWKAVGPAPMDVAPVGATVDGLSNGLVDIAIDPATATFSVDGLAGFGRLVDGGDAGDTYNYSPPANDQLVDGPVRAATVTVLEAGPLRAQLRLDAVHHWPVQLDGHDRTGGADVHVVTTIELQAGERLVRVTIRLDNVCRDHRLRLHVPLPSAATSSHAECAFAVVERGLTAEGGPTELGLPTYPSRRFVQAGGVTVVHEGLTEYELVDVRDGAAHELALTLLRASRYLSRGPMAYRPLPAGPEIEIDGSQVLGRHVLRLGVQVGAADPYALADDLLLPLQLTTGAGIGTLPGEHQVLGVEGAEVSSLRRRAGTLELRVFNPTAAATTVRVLDRSGWLVDLRGRPLQPFDGSFPLGPWAIATASLP
jgi:mannosylglycerate hydrolase